MKLLSENDVMLFIDDDIEKQAADNIHAFVVICCLSFSENSLVD